MPHYEWRGSGTFTDNYNDRDVANGETVKLPARVGDPQPELTQVDAPSEESVSDADESAPEAADSAEDTPLAEKEYSELRQMAVDADTDEIDGRSSKDEIIAYFEE